MTYGDLRFIYLSSSVQRAVSAKYKELLGKSFFDYIHPDEAKLARKDLNAFMDVHNLYGSVTRCRFKNVCPEWQERRLARQPHTMPAEASAAALQEAATQGGMSSRGLGRNGLKTNDDSMPNNATALDSSPQHDKLSTLTAAAAALSDEPGSEEGCKDYEDIFQNGEEDDFMILDVVMNVVSDEVVLGFFHIDGQGLYKGFWSNGICGESKDSLATLAPEIMRHLKDSVSSVSTRESSAKSQLESSRSSTPSSPPRQYTDNRTKRIFQLYDSHNRNLLLTWPEPGRPSGDSGMAYNPDLYTQIVKSHHIPADALENTTCLKRFCSKHALPSINPTGPAPSYQVESVFIPYGHIIFACFQTSPSSPVNWPTMTSPTSSISATQASHIPSTSPGARLFGSGLDGVSSNEHLSGLGLLSSPAQSGSSLLALANSQGTSTSAQNSPLVIPSLPSLSPFLKHAVAGQMTMAPGQVPSPSLTGPMRNITGSGAHTSLYHPYTRSSGLTTLPSTSSSPSSLPLPEAMQESLSFLNDYKAGDIDKGRGLTGGRQSAGVSEGPHSMWHASTPHPAIAAMVGHALAPSSPSFQRTVVADGRSSHSRQKSSTETHSGKDIDSKSRKIPSSPRHPAHDAAIRKKSSSSTSSSSPPASGYDMDMTGSVDNAMSSNSNGHGGHTMRVSPEEKACESCGTTNSPEWRRGQSGKKDLCNACGLRYSRSVARQNRLAQKQLEGKGTKAKGAKAGKAAKASKKTSGVEASVESTQTSQGYMDPQQHQHHPQQQQQQQQQQQHLHPYPTYTNGIVPSFPVAVSQPSFYRGQYELHSTSSSSSAGNLHPSFKLSSSNYTPSTRSSPEPAGPSPTDEERERVSVPEEAEETEVEFLHTPSPSILCPVCQDVCRDPVITNGCNHSYCAACIYHSIEIEPFCPLCRSRIKVEDLHPNLALSGLISELLVYCSNKKYGCPQIVRQDALHGHVLYCSYAPKVCPNKAVGCPYKGTIRDSKEHLKNCVYERFKGYIDTTNKRFEKLESILADQTKEIEKLQRIIRSGKGVVYTSGSHKNGISSASDTAVTDGQPGESSTSSGVKRTVVSTFPHDEITCHKTIAIHPCGVTSVAVNNDRVFAGAHDGSTKVFDVNSGELLKDSKGHTMSVWGLAVVPSGERYFSAGSDGTIKVWDWLKEDDEACLVKSIQDHQGKVYGLVVDQGRLYSASSDKTIKVWDTDTLECLATFQGHTGGVNCLASLMDARAHQLVTGSSDKTIKLWDVTTGTCLKTVRRGTSEVLDVAVGDGMLFGSTYDAVIHVYDLNETRELGTLSGHNWEVWQLEYGQGHLFSASFDHTIKRWDPRRFQCDLTLKGHKSFVHGMALAENYLVTGCADRTIKIWR
ncbi:hypothetical protein BGX28_000872 [Mortierella sp. GBA30]|nr:hypothetical protein BGX28_000872 [Mortierella sp. GBA30]